MFFLFPVIMYNSLIRHNELPSDFQPISIRPLRDPHTHLYTIYAMPQSVSGSACPSRSNLRPLQVPLGFSYRSPGRNSRDPHANISQIQVFILYVHVSFSTSATLPITTPYERATPPLRTHLLVPCRPNWSRAHPKLPSTIHTRFLCRHRDARFTVFAPRYRFLREEFCPIFL
jgi:hypothetical protein